MKKEWDGISVTYMMKLHLFTMCKSTIRRSQILLRNIHQEHRPQNGQATVRLVG